MPIAHPLTLDDLVGRWTDLDGTELNGAVCVTEILSRTRGAVHLALELSFSDGARYFTVDFWVREIPDAPSPFVLLNTRVSDRHGSARSWYQDVLSLLREAFPPRTTLVTFVRQSDSLAVLEDARRTGHAVDPRDLPLVRLFEDAGWSFTRLSLVSAAENPRRRHLIRFTTLS